jgi:hypothetical protein
MIKGPKDDQAAQRELNRFLNRATFGVWGPRRQIARTELRAAVEDRIWRLQLRGLDPAAAQQQALRHLGPPTTIARGLVQVHSAPLLVRSALLCALAAALGVSTLGRSEAQVLAAPLLPELVECDYSPAGLDTLDRSLSASPARVRQEVLSYGQNLRSTLARVGQARLEANCRAYRDTAYQYLNVQSLTKTLEAQGVRTTLTRPADRLSAVPYLPPPSAASLWWSFPHSRLSVPVERTLVDSELVYLGSFIERLLQSSGLPVGIQGQVNPTLSVGTVRFQLGTPATPIYASQMYSYALQAQLQQSLNNRAVVALPSRPWDDVVALLPGEGVERTLRVSLPDGTLVTVLSAGRLPDQVDLYTAEVRGGLLQVLLGSQSTRTARVQRFADLRAPSQPGQQRFMLLRLMNLNSLSDLSYSVLRCPGPDCPAS